MVSLFSQSCPQPSNLARGRSFDLGLQSFSRARLSIKNWNHAKDDAGSANRIVRPTRLF